MEEHNNDNNEFDESTEGANEWLKENLRIVISIVIVIAIAGGIYSYSKRSQEPVMTEEEAGEEIALEDLIETEELEGDIEEGSEMVAGEEPAEKETAKPAEKKDQEVTSIATSKETQGSFVETAQRGDGLTHLARRALANYLEKNPDSGLTPEHKIYIEDYLRKKVGHSGGIRVGTSVEFSKSLINEAIASSKNLNERQLQNLHKYAVRVPSLS